VAGLSVERVPRYRFQLPGLVWFGPWSKIDGGQQPFSVLHSWLNEDVKISGKTRSAMERQRMGTDDHKLNAVGV
jgi:hypothetical protein